MLNLLITVAGVGLLLLHERKTMAAYDDLVDKVDTLTTAVSTAVDTINDLAEQIRNGGAVSEEQLQELVDQLDSTTQDLQKAIDDSADVGSGDDTGGGESAEPGTETPAEGEAPAPAPADPAAEGDVQVQQTSADSAPVIQEGKRAGAQSDTQRGVQQSQARGNTKTSTPVNKPLPDTATSVQQTPIPGRPMVPANPAAEFIPAEAKGELSPAPSPSPTEGTGHATVLPGQKGASTGPTDAFGNPIPVPLQPPAAI